MTKAVAVALLLFFLPGIHAAGADQNAPELDQWFEQLATTQDSRRADILTRKIWNAWLRSDREDVTALMVAGIAMMSQGKLADALVRFNRIIEADPAFAEGWNKRATVLYHMRLFADSIADIKQTLRLEPRHFGALSGLGLIMLERGNNLAALAAFEKAQAINPHAPGVSENIAYVRSLLRKQST